VEIKELADKMSTRAEEDRFNLFDQLTVTTLCHISEQQKTISWILLTLNKIIGALSEIRESMQEDKKMASKPGNKLEMLFLDRGRKKAPNSLNNGDKSETTVLD